VSNTITIQDGFPVGSASVTVDISHRRIGALVLSLTADPPTWAGNTAASRRVVLKERGLGRLGDNMYMTTFSDDATQAFPVAAVRSSFLYLVFLKQHFRP
jgi:subtilisin-like proprotein convertase family protein